MSVAGLCHVCEAATGTHTCERCGGVACDDHWERAVRACLDCVDGRSGPGRPGGVGFDG